MISAKFPFDKKRMDVLGQSMAYVEVGSGDPIVFLHGNPSSSYLWRNVIPHLQELGRCIAPDLIGMGNSEKLPSSGPGSYTFVEHRRYLDALLEDLNVNERVTLVLHDWANRHRSTVKGIAYMEAIVKPRTWNDWPEATRATFQALRSEAGEQIILEHNFFVETIVPRSVLRGLTDDRSLSRPPLRAHEGRQRSTCSRWLPQWVSSLWLSAS